MSDEAKVTVGGVMSESVHTIDAKARVAEATDALREKGVSSLLFERRAEHDEYGLLVVSDIAANVIAETRAPDRVNVYEIMSKPVLCVYPQMDIRYCARMFDPFGLSRAPVVDGGKVIGLVSYTDMVMKGLLAKL